MGLLVWALMTRMWSGGADWATVIADVIVTNSSEKI
jgi:hypothetical protein